MSKAIVYRPQQRWSLSAATSKNDELYVQGKEEGEVGEEQKMRLFFPMQKNMFTRRFSGTRAATHANLP